MRHSQNYDDRNSVSLLQKVSLVRLNRDAARIGHLSLIGCTLLIVAGLTSACFESKIVTTKLEDPKQNPQNRMNGVFYALPRTVITVDVPILKTEPKEGHYRKWARCFFPTEDVIDCQGANSTKCQPKFSIQADSVVFDNLAVPDPDQIYIIKTQGGRLETRNLEVALTESGLFVKGAVEVEDKSLDVLTSTMKDVVGITSGAFLPGSVLGRSISRVRTEELSELSPAQHRCYNEILNRIEEAEESLDKIEPSNPPTEPSASSSPKQGDKKNRNDRTAQKRTSTRRIAPSDEDIFSDPDADNSRPKEQQEKMMQEQYERLRRKEAELRKELKARKSSSERLNLLRAIFDELNAARDDDVTFRQAQAIYERIVDLENKRDNLLGGTNSTAPPDSGAFKRMLDELDATIKAYKSKYFLGFPKQSATVLSFKMNPLDSSRTKEDTRDLFTFSTLDGVCKIIEDKQGVSIDENFTSSTCSNSAVVRLKIKPGDNGVGGADVNGTMADKVRSIELSQTGKRGFYYRIPGRAVVSLVMAGRHETEMSRETLSIAQFGTTVSLPSSTGGRRTKYTLELFGSTGGLRNFIMGSDPLVNRSNITDITDSASTILETLGERKEARRKASDELSELERRRKILEEKKKIKELEEDLGVIP